MGYGLDNSYGRNDLSGYGKRDSYGRDDSYGKNDSYGFDSNAFDAGLSGLGGFGGFDNKSFGGFDDKSFGYDDNSYGGYGSNLSHGKGRRGRDSFSGFNGFSGPKGYGTGYAGVSHGIDSKIDGYGANIGKRSLSFGSGIDSRISGLGSGISRRASGFSAPRSASFNKYGPFGYNQPHVEYNAFAPKGAFQTQGPKEDLNVYSANLATRTFSGAAGIHGPKLGNRASQARMAVYSPSIAFKMPTVGIQGGDAYTASPGVKKTHAVTGASMQGPKIDLYAPQAGAKLQAPQGHFATKSPHDLSHLGTTSTYKHHESPVAYVRPSKW